jgi:hypothetical protein
MRGAANQGQKKLFTAEYAENAEKSWASDFTDSHG